jgi:hypothetical protein
MATRRRSPSPRTFTSPRTVSGTLIGGLVPAAAGATVAPPMGAGLFVVGAVAAYALITHSPRLAPHCPFCDSPKAMGRAECWGCRRTLS